VKLVMPASSAPVSALNTDTLIRGALFVAVLLIAWISFHPFQSLAAPPRSVGQGGDLANQLGYSTLFLLLTAWTYRHEPRRLLLLMRPALLALIAWCVLSIVISWEPSLAARRLAFTLVVMSIAAMVLLLPRNPRHFSELLAIAVLAVLAACYFGVAFLPDVAVHQATDYLEPEHAGNWRGVFPHKNDAGATMVLFIFAGLFVARVRSFVVGAAIVVLAGTFLAFTQSKTAIGVLPLAFIIAAIIARIRRPGFAVALAIGVLALINLFSVGTVAFEPVRALVAAIMPDATFTGRTEIWEIALQALWQRPFTGYGFSSFWGTEQVIYGMGDTASWADAATDAHNAYLNLALTIGLPGVALAVVWAVVLPILDFHRRLRDGGRGSPMHTLFLRVCLFSAYASCFESALFQQVGAVWFFFLMAAFGLRYLSLTRTSPL
jgi:O-antigen ligase